MIQGSRYSRYVVALAAVLLIAFTVHVALSGTHSGAGLRVGSRIPPFAAPLAVGGPPGEVDIATRPDEGAAGKVPACRERGVGILNVCALYERGPVVLALFFNAGGCGAILTRLQQVAHSYPQVSFAAVAVREDAASVARLVRAQRIALPVGVDPEGRLGGLYTMVQCPQIEFVYPGGATQSAPLLGMPSTAALRARVGALLATARARGWTPRGNA